MGKERRPVGWAIGGLLLMAGLVVHAVAGGGYGLIVIGLVVIASALLERRYRQRPDAELAESDRWDPTGERFIDSETGIAMQVWVDPLTGERRYLPVADRPLPNRG